MQQLVISSEVGSQAPIFRSQLSVRDWPTTRHDTIPSRLHHIDNFINIGRIRTDLGGWPPVCFIGRARVTTSLLGWFRRTRRMISDLAFLGM